MMINRKIIGIVTVSVLAIAAIGALVLSSRTTPPPERVVIQLPWSHSASYAGFYSADRMGDYSRRGLKAEFLTGGPKINPLDAVLAGKAQFTLLNGAEVIRARSLGNSIKAVACIYRRSPLVYITLASSGISHPRQFEGKTVKVTKQNTVVLHALASRFAVKPSSIENIYTRDLNKFYSGEVDVWSGYSSVSERRIAESGRKINVIHPDNYGVHFYYSCITTTDRIINETPEYVTRFLQATLLEGWPRAFREPEKSAALVSTYGNVDKLEQLTESISIMLPLVDTGTGDIGWMEPTVWNYMIDSLREQGLLKTPVEIQDVFTQRFLKEVFDKPGEAS